MGEADAYKRLPVVLQGKAVNLAVMKQPPDFPHQVMRHMIKLLRTIQDFVYPLHQRVVFFLR